MNYIRIKDKQYPCELTMGAFRRYNRLTGRNAAKIDGSDPVEAVDLMYCATASACSAEGVPFDYTPETFADNITAQHLADFFAGTEDDLPERSKKKEKASRT
jgi:hypothetical protein